MKNYLEYNGYRGTVAFSAEDRVFYGKIHGINDVVTFEGETVDELEIAFKEAVEDYLDICARYGKEPEKEYKGQFNVRISPELHKKTALMAAKENLTLNKIVEVALMEYANKVENDTKHYATV